MKRPLMLPLVPLYAAGVMWKNARFDRGAGVEALKWPVVSVGSLSAGGAGKTPVVAAMVGLLREAGWIPDVLSRGYGRDVKRAVAKVPVRVDPHGAAKVFGDEPLMLARGTGAPVFVASDRVRAGRLAENSLDMFQKHVHLLDDGFQHRQLKRDFDVVLVTAEDVQDRLIPAGNLREPMASLKRASAVVVREEESDAVMPVVSRFVRAGTPVWAIRRSLRVGGVTGRPVAFCGIARPEAFFAGLRTQGVSPVADVTFEDHADYRPSMMARLMREAKRAGADGWVTTAKDLVKLDAGKLQYLQGIGPVAVADVVVEFADASEVKADLLRVLEGTKGQWAVGR